VLQQGKEYSMSVTITLDEAQAKLKDLVHQLVPGDEIIITENQQTVAKLVSEISQPRHPRVPGLGRGMIVLQQEDEQHLEGFAEYMP
jgi:antitoxin (DNA-binding transcriptional repressor) of toxin-antitoxin stability system